MQYLPMPISPAQPGLCLNEQYLLTDCISHEQELCLVWCNAQPKFSLKKKKRKREMERNNNILCIPPLRYKMRHGVAEWFTQQQCWTLKYWTQESIPDNLILLQILAESVLSFFFFFPAIPIRKDFYPKSIIFSVIWFWKCEIFAWKGTEKFKIESKHQEISKRSVKLQCLSKISLWSCIQILFSQ